MADLVILNAKVWTGVPGAKEAEALAIEGERIVAVGSTEEIRRRVSGDNLDQLLPENGFHVARALVGSEGTCVTVLEATVRLVPSPRHRVLVVLGYPEGARDEGGLFREASAIRFARSGSGLVFRTSPSTTTAFVPSSRCMTISGLATTLR